MRQRVGLAIVMVLIISTGVVAWVSFHHPYQPPPVDIVQMKASSKPATPVTPAAPTAPVDPLTIAAIKSRTYAASTITVVRNLGEEGGYTSQVVSYQSDSLTIYALLDTPDGTAPAGGWPVIIFNHGYIIPSEYSTTSSYASWEGALAKGGFMVIKPDYRGNGSSQGQPDGGHFSPVYAYDVLNLVASVGNIPGANPTRLGMFGHSMGGHETLRAIVTSPKIKATVIAAGVVGSFNDIFYNWPSAPDLTDQPLALTQGIRQSLINKYGTPQTDPDFWNSASAINYVASVAGPVQVDQDVNDSVVPKLFADHLVSALQSANKSVTNYTYPGDDHNFTNSFSLLMSRAVAFYSANL